MRTFHLKITLADESTKVFAWCIGQTATELLQISPDEFNELSEVLYSYSMTFRFFPQVYIYIFIGDGRKKKKKTIHMVEQVIIRL